MKSAFRAAQTAVYLSLSLLDLAGAAHAAIEPPQIAPQLPSETVMPAKPAIVATLEAAAEGLQMPSETDAPFKVVFFESKPEKTRAEAVPMTPAQIAKLVGAPDDAEPETRDLIEFFSAATTVEDWMNADEKATATRFAALLQTLKTQLKDVQVVVWGDAEKQVVIIGKCESGAAGLTTVVVES